MNTKNHPGVYIPPPLIYVALFSGSVLLQKLWPLGNRWLHTIQANIIGWLLIAFCLLFVVAALRRFIITKNTLVTIKPATSLQTEGIYAYSRNPMYLSLLLLYTGLAFFFGNWWTFFLIPLLITIIQQYVIRKEEQYLLIAFGEQYYVYKKKVRRWI